ncbi:MAG: hypothetical protein J5689_02955, partial [Clostridia bacterium]|nr:hypothetical protein [Clostridia bacterium]
MGAKVFNFLANAVTGEMSNEAIGLETGFLKVMTKVVSFLWNQIMSVVHFIVKFALNLCDLMQYFIQRLVGIDFWNDASSNLSEIGESDVIFRFLLSDTVRRAFRGVVIVSIILLIIFSIVAIVRSDYQTAVNGDLKSKKQVLVASLKAMFMIILIPLMLIFGLLASNAILASLINAISPTATQVSLGGKIFSASSYSANRYREYAQDGVRNMASYQFTFAYNKTITEETDSESGATYYIYTIYPIGETFGYRFKLIDPNGLDDEI